MPTGPPIEANPSSTNGRREPLRLDYRTCRLRRPRCGCAARSIRGLQHRMTSTFLSLPSMRGGRSRVPAAATICQDPPKRRARKTRRTQPTAGSGQKLAPAQPARPAPPVHLPSVPIVTLPCAAHRLPSPVCPRLNSTVRSISQQPHARAQRLTSSSTDRVGLQGPALRCVRPEPGRPRLHGRRISGDAAPAYSPRIAAATSATGTDPCASTRS